MYAFEFLNFKLVSEFVDAVVLRLHSVLCRLGSATLFSYTSLTPDSGSSRVAAQARAFGHDDVVYFWAK